MNQEMDLSEEKKELIKTILEEASKKGQKELIPFLLAASMQASKKGIVFTEEESNMIFSSLKEGKSPDEQKKLDMIIKMAGSIANKQLKK